MSSCTEISGQLAALSAEVAALNNKFALKSDLEKYIPKQEKPQIIQQSVASAESLIVPALMLVIGNAINGLRPDIAAAAGVASKALGVATEAAGTAASAIAKVAGIAAQIAAILASIATLLVLGSRIDAVESGLSALGNDVSKILGLLLPIKNTADTALVTAGTASSNANRAQKTADEALSLAKVVENALNILSEFFRGAAREFLLGIANLAESISELSAEIAAIKPAVADAKNTATGASTKADTALGTATSASTKADTALGTATSASTKANTALGTATGASTKADTALGTATSASTKANTALGTATSASTKADTALGTATSASTKADTALGKITGLESRIGSIERELAALKNKLGNVVNNFFTNVVNISQNVANNIVNNVTNQTIVNNIGGKVDLSRIEAKIDAIPAGMIAAFVASPAVFQRSVTAAATGTCQTMQPGGCGDAAMQRNNNNLFGRLGNLFNTGANAAQLALLSKIDLKMGVQIAGGLSGKLVDGFKWLQIDRVLNVLNTAATIHNAAMLSNDIGMTLVGAINNILQVVGLKDDKGQAFDVGAAINSTIQGLITAAIGAENYAQLTTSWAKANRIYQASVNILNSFQGLSSAILTGLEMTAGKVGKIGNALRDAGQVLDNAYSWMNPQPKFNRVTQTLENLQQGASTIQMVTQAPLDIIQATTDLTTQTTELVNAVKDDTKPENKGKEAPEPDKLKADNDAGKLVSVGSNLTDLDLEADA